MVFCILQLKSHVIYYLVLKDNYNQKCYINQCRTKIIPCRNVAITHLNKFFFLISLNDNKHL